MIKTILYKFYFLVVFTCLISITKPLSAQYVSYEETFKPASIEGLSLKRYEKLERNVYTDDSAIEIVDKLIEYIDVPISKSNINDKIRNRTQSIGSSIRNSYIGIIDDVDKSSFIHIDMKTGSFLISRGKAAYNDEGDTPQLVRGKTAEKKLVQHLKELDIMPNSKEMRLLNVKSLMMYVPRENGTSDTYTKYTIVDIRRVINGMKVMGASRIVAHLTEQGSLNTLMYQWTPVRELNVNEDEVIGYTEISNSTTKGLIERSKESDEIIADSQEIVLYDDGNGVIEPAIFVRARIRIGEHADNLADFYIPLLKNSKAIFPM